MYGCRSDINQGISRLLLPCVSMNGIHTGFALSLSCHFFACSHQCAGYTTWPIPTACLRCFFPANDCYPILTQQCASPCLLLLNSPKSSIPKNSKLILPHHPIFFPTFSRFPSFLPPVPQEDREYLVSLDASGDSCTVEIRRPNGSSFRAEGRRHWGRWIFFGDDGFF